MHFQFWILEMHLWLLESHKKIVAFANAFLWILQMHFHEFCKCISNFCKCISTFCKCICILKNCVYFNLLNLEYILHIWNLKNVKSHEFFTLLWKTHGFCMAFQLFYSILTKPFSQRMFLTEKITGKPCKSHEFFTLLWKTHQSILPWYMSQYNNLAMRVANNSAMQQPFNNLQSQTNVQPYPYWNGRFL